MRIYQSALIAVVVGAAGPPARSQPVIQIDYRFDTNNFFGPVGSAQRVAMQAAADRLAVRLGDRLSAINPGGGNTWTTDTFDPADSSRSVNLTNLTIPQNTILVFAGGQELGENTLGIGGPGGFSAGGSQAFVDTVAGRGQPGALQSSSTDFGPWGGSVSFDSVGTDWHFALTPPTGNQADFLSVAQHELGHLLGFGTAESWDNRIVGTTFTGPAARAANGGVNPSVTGDGGHWVQGTTSQGQPVAMEPAILLGTRKEFTELDFAGLADLGWEVTPVPEPAAVLGLAVAGLAASRRVRRVAAVA